MKQKGLGRGLDAIFATSAAGDLGGVRQVGRAMEGAGELAVEVIVPNPDQPRRHFDDEALAELADSIRVLGVIQPVTVRRDGAVTTDGEGARYTIISGERRWRAAQLAGLETVPVYIRAATDQTLHEMALVENIQREDLNPMEVALSMQRLVDECGLTQDGLSERLGKKRSTVANYLRLLKLPDEVQLALKEGYISMGHAKAIASADGERQVRLLRKTIKKGLSVRQVEELAAGRAVPVHKTSTAGEEEFPESYARLVELLEGIFSSNITVKSGKIIIGFEGENDIERFIERLS